MSGDALSDLIMEKLLNICGGNMKREGRNSESRGLCRSLSEGGWLDWFYLSPISIFAIVYTGGLRGDGFCEGFVSVGEYVASDDSGIWAYGKGLDGVYMEIAFRARRCSIPVASLHLPETGKRLLVAALRKFGKFSWRFDVCSKLLLWVKQNCIAIDITES